MHKLRHSTHVPIRGHFLLQITETDGTVVDQREADNIMCAAGLTALAQAINWSGITDQNTNMGNAFAVSTLAPIWGAIGTGAATPIDTDTALVAEEARQTVLAGGTTASSHLTPGTVSWSFLFGFPSAAEVITECGIFVQGTSVAGSGLLLDHATISPSVTQSTTQLATLVVTFSFGN